jgi:hypothetical protein
MSEIMIDDAIYAAYLEYRAARSGANQLELTQPINRDDFYRNTYALHERFMAGEFSLGYMAQEPGLSKADLYHLLDAMGPKVTNL